MSKGKGNTADENTPEPVRTPMGTVPLIPASGFAFLQTLAANNNRDWFQAHKGQYLEETVKVERFVQQVLGELNLHDAIETPTGKHSMHRIYRDTRFGSDKTPYAPRWSGSFRRATRFRRGGYYFHFEPGGKSLIGGGFRGPNAADLKRIREEIAFDDAPLRKILRSKSFTDTFGTLQGEQVKTAPKGFSATHEAIDLLRYKQFLLIRRFTDEEVLSAGFFKEVNRTFKNMRPFFNFMSEVLTTDVNGLEC